MELVSSNSSFQWIKDVSETPLTRQLGFMLGLSASIALAMSVVFWSQSEDYVPLYMDLSMQSASEVVDVLERNNTSFRMDRMSGTIQVPAEQLHRLRMQLAAEGLPSDEGNGGFDMLSDEPQLGLSGFMERARYDHALEQELAKTVSTVENVRSARVHLAVPKASGFIRKSGRPAASVLVNLYNGRELSKRQLAGITHLVAASVPELFAEDVSVVDQEGRLLSDSGSDMGLSAGIEQLDMAKAIEQSYVDRILQILVPIAGSAGVRTQVNADLDFTSFESTSETYAPETSVRSEQIEQARNESSKPNGGVPGTLANQPPDNPALAAQAQGQTRSTETDTNSKTLRNYELDKTISHKRQAPGMLRRLTVAVVLDHRQSFDAEGLPVKTPYTQQEIDQMTELVREAVGFDASRGDRVAVSNTAFAALPEIAEPDEASILEAAWIWQSARIVVALVICLLLVFAVIRPAIRGGSRKSIAAASENLPVPRGNGQVKSTSVANGSNKNTGTVGGGNTGNAQLPSDVNNNEAPKTQAALSSDTQALLVQQQETPLYRHQLDAARDLVEQQPETVAHVVKHWVAKDE